MKVKKTVILAGVLLISALLSGCGSKTDNTVVQKKTPDDICEISVENVTLDRKNQNIEQIEELVNEITLPAIGCRVKIIDCPIGQHEELTKKINAGIEQVDIIETGLTTSLSSLASSGVLTELEDLLHEYAPDLEQKEGRLLQATTINGHIYALTANLYCSRAEGIGYNSDIAAKYNIVFPDKVDLDILTGVGKQLAESGSGIYLTTQGDGELSAIDSFYDMETFGGGFNYGVIMNPLVSTDIVNLYETDEYRNYCRVMKKWRDLGYMPSDSLISGQNGQYMFNSGQSFFQYSSVSPGTEMMDAHKELDFEEEYIPITGNRITTRLAQEFAWGITRGCTHPEKAMELLNLIYTNADLANLLQYGRENIEYINLGDGVIQPVSDEDGSLYSSYFSVFGDTMQMYHYASDSDNKTESIKDFFEQSQTGLTFGYVFQADDVFANIQAVQNVVNEYRPVLETGMADDSDLLLDEFLNALDAAGINEIIEENQKQLDEWLENQ